MNIDEIKDLIWYTCFCVGLTTVAVRFFFALIRSGEDR
jgi:hypothetical protein